MARPASSQPTDGELEILKVLWEAGSATLGTICTALRQKREVATTTVATMLKLMQNKKLVTRKRTAKGYLWSAKINRDAASKGLLGKVLDGVFDGSAKHLVAHLVEDGKLNEDERREIIRMLKKEKKG